MTSSTPPVVLADADNTLWDTDAVFARAQLGLLQAVEAVVGSRPQDAEPLRWLRSFDQAIAAVDQRGLRYPPAYLAHALAAGLLGAPADAAARDVVAGRTHGALSSEIVDDLVGGYLAALAAMPEALPGVHDGLTAAHDAGIEVWVLTEGAAAQQRERASRLGLLEFVRGVTEATKSPEQFARQRQRFGSRPLFVVGDQPDRDITPAKAAGCATVLVPSRFRPTWHRENAWRDADYVASAFDDATSWILTSPDALRAGVGAPSEALAVPRAVG